MVGGEAAFDLRQRGTGPFGAREDLRFLGPNGHPLTLSMPPAAARLRMHVAARRADADWLHGVAVLTRAAGGLRVLGFEHPGPLQILRTLDESRGVDVQGVEAAARWLLAEEGCGEEVAREFERRLVRAGVDFGDRPRPRGRALEARARALLDGVQGVGAEGATEWRPRRETVLAHDPAHAWLRPRLAFAAGEADSSEFCTTHPTPAEVGVLALEGEWSTSTRADDRRQPLRLGFLLHPLGWSVALLDPRRADLAVVVRRASVLDWALYDRADYEAAFLSSRVPFAKDSVRQRRRPPEAGAGREGGERRDPR